MQQRRIISARRYLELNMILIYSWVLIGKQSLISPSCHSSVNHIVLSYGFGIIIVKILQHLFELSHIFIA